MPAAVGIAEGDKIFYVDAFSAALEEDFVFGGLHPREWLFEDELLERFGF